jgi:chorismate-pyruvate lyase
VNSKGTPAARASSHPIYSDFYPLDEFYALRGDPAPALQRIEPVELPEPWRSLLVHQSDMTSTLENFYKEQLHIEALARRVNENEYFREVALVLNDSGKRVEYGAIKILLDSFPLEARQEILREQQPLGRILNVFSVVFASRPRAFLRMASDKFIENALNLEKRDVLFGRRNTLLDEWGRPLAEIVEILPP